MKQRSIRCPKTMSGIGNCPFGKQSNDHSKAISYLKREMLKAINANDQKLIEELIKQGDEVGLKRLSYFPHGFTYKMEKNA